MKKNRRNITVGGNKYVWWYRIDAGLCVITVSPFEDKTSKIHIEFKDTKCDCDYGYCFTFPLYVELEKDREQSRFKLIEPGMASLLAACLCQRELFQTRKEITLHGYELLADRGYELGDVENGIDF